MPFARKFVLGRRRLIAAAAVARLARPYVARAEPTTLVLGTNGGEG